MTFPALPLAVTLAILAGVVGSAQAAGSTEDFRRTITLSGSGETSAAPDRAYVTTGVVSQAKTAREALTANNRDMTAVVAGLKEAGIAEKDIQTSNFTVGPRYHYPKDKPPVIIGYQVSNTVTITVRDLARIGDTLDRIVTLGSNTIHGIRFAIADPDRLEDEARKAALADARRRAEVYATEGGFKLARILTVSEAGGGRRPQIALARTAKFEAADSVPVQGGELSVTVNVNVTWEIE